MQALSSRARIIALASAVTLLSAAYIAVVQKSQSRAGIAQAEAQCSLADAGEQGTVYFVGCGGFF